ncbi:MAG: DMT family transporter [Pseudomonadota bacterium]
MPLAHLYFVASAFLLALGSVWVKALLSSRDTIIDPLPFLTLQLIGGVAFLIAVQGVRGWRGVDFPPLARPAVAGVILGVGSVGTIMALASIPASEASVIFATQPIVIIALARLLLGERIARAVLVLSLVGVAGVGGIVIGGSGFDTTGRSLGVALALLSTVCAAIYVVWMRRLSGSTSVLATLIIVQSTACLVAASVTALSTATALSAAHFGDGSSMLAAAGTGVLYYGMAFYVYLLGLRTTEASIAGVYLNLVPVFTIALASATLSERLSPTQWIAASIVITAVTSIAITAPRERRPKRT